MTLAPTCPHCGQLSALVKGKDIYPHRRDLFALNFYRCSPCDAYVGTHRGTKTPLGTPANATLRAARSQAHAAFDPIWREGKLSRSAAYAWLSRQLELPKSETHIGMFNAAQCEATVVAVASRFGVRTVADDFDDLTAKAAVRGGKSIAVSLTRRVGLDDGEQ